MPNKPLLKICNSEISLIEEEIKQYKKSFLDKSSLHYVTLWRRLRDLHELREIYEAMDDKS